jgi:hypothetical protein
LVEQGSLVKPERQIYEQIKRQPVIWESPGEENSEELHFPFGDRVWKCVVFFVIPYQTMEQ